MDKKKQEATDSVEWVTHDLPTALAQELLQLESLKGLVYRGNKKLLEQQQREGFQPLLLHEKVWFQPKSIVTKTWIKINNGRLEDSHVVVA